LLLWSVIGRDRRAFFALALGALVALVTLYVFTPPFWPDPVGGLTRFLQSNLSRARTITIKTMFLGRIYETPNGSLPWYNTVVWLVIATPLGFLVLSLIGGARAVHKWKSEPLGLLFLLSGVSILVLRALPHTPGHDGTRQLSAAFGGMTV